MKAMLLIGLLLCLLAGCGSIPSGRSIPQRSAGPWENQEVRAGNGAFVFRNIVLDGSTLPGSWNIKGFVHNSTNQDWKRVRFDFQLYDENGNTLEHYIDGSITFTAHLLMNRDEHSFTTNYFKIRGKEESLRRLAKITITHRDTYFGKQIFIMVKPQESHERFFEDDAIKVFFLLSEKQIGIVLHNKLNNPMKIDWNNVSYVDITGLAHGVFHTGVRYMERDRPQVPTIIPPGAKIEDAVIPLDHVSYTTGGGWSSRELFPGMAESDIYLGKSFSIFMPLEFGGAIKNYSFVFRIIREKM